MVDPRLSKLQLCSLLQKLGKTLAMSLRGLKSTENGTACRKHKPFDFQVDPIPPAPPADSTVQVHAQWNAVYDAHNEVACLMLGSMTPELHRQFENSSPYEMIQELKSMFEKQAGVERFDLIQTFHAYKQEKGKPVGPYVIKMKGYVEQLERLGYVLHHK
ncbi:hypothetical protein Tco_0242547 [Tanacetum coccineum]